jgi:hypothetical protein
MVVGLPGLGRTPMGGYEVVAVSTIWKWSPDQIEKIRVGHGLAKRHVAGHDAGSSVGFITEVGAKPLPSGMGI